VAAHATFRRAIAGLVASIALGGLAATFMTLPAAAAESPSTAAIVGVVKSPSNAVLSKAYVTASRYTGSVWVEQAVVRTDSKGKYALRDLAPGSYRLRFEGAKGEYSPLFSGGAASLDSAVALNVGVGGTVTANATFPKGTGSITGRSTAWWDEGEYPLSKALAVAIPVSVSSTYPDYPRSLDLTGRVASAPSTSKGSWAIKNLLPGRYVVKVYPQYYNERSFFVSAGHPAGNATVELQQATIYTVTAGKTITSPRSYSYATYNGGSLTVRVGTDGGAGVPNATVLLQNDIDPAYLFTGTTNAAGMITLGRSGSRHVIQAGRYALIVTTNGTWAPLTRQVDIEPGNDELDVQLANPPAPSGFMAAPFITQSSPTAGTRFVVNAQARRATSTLSYQWLRNGSAIYGADEAGYTARAGDIGAQLSVRVSSAQFGYPTDTATASVAGLIVSNASVPTTVTAPTITPATNARVGTVLRVLPGTWSVAGLAYEYEWFRDGIPFANDGGSYTVTLADLGSAFTATVRATKAGHPDATASTPTAVTPGFAASTTPVSGFVVTASTAGVAKGSKKYTVTPGVWTAPNPTFSFEWLRGGVSVGTGDSFVEKPTTALLAQTLEVRATATADGFGESTAVATARKATLRLQVTQAPVATVRHQTTPLTAAARVVFGQTVLVSSGEWMHGTDAPGELDYTYQWLRKTGSGKPVKIVGATNAQYTPLIGDIGASLTVTVTARSTRWADATVTVAAGKVVGTDYLTSMNHPLAIDATPSPGIHSYVLERPWYGPEVKVSYQWYGCALPKCTAKSPLSKFTKISRATDYLYQVDKKYAKGRIFASVSATAPGAAPARIDTPALTVTADRQLIGTYKPQITTSDVVPGTSLHSQAGSFNANATITREWQVCTVDCSSSTAIWTAGAGENSGSTYMLRGADWGTGESFVRIKETGRRSGYGAGVNYSQAKPIGLGTSYFSPSSVISTGPDSWALDRSPSDSTGSSVLWFVGDEQRGTGDTFEALPSDAGRRIYSVQAYTAQGYKDVAVVRVHRPGPAVSLTARPVAIVGDRFGDVLTLTDNVPWDLPEAPYANWTVTYYWKYGDGEQVWREGSETFIPQSNQTNRPLSVRIVASSGVFGNFDTTAAISGGLKGGGVIELESPVTVEYTGEAVPGVLLRSAPVVPLVADSTVNYYWQSSTNGTTWTDIPGARSSEYETVLTDSLRQIRLQVYVLKDGHGTYGYPSTPVQMLEGDVVRVVGVPVLTGDARVGATLTTTTGAWSDGATPHIQWLLNGRVIPGATSVTYVPLAENVGDEISARVTGRQAGRLGVSVETAAFVIAPS
jgi:hypothetical protein